MTGNPLLLPEYGFYEGHLNCYNRDAGLTRLGTRRGMSKGPQHIQVMEPPIMRVEWQPDTGLPKGSIPSR